MEDVLRLVDKQRNQVQGLQIYIVCGVYYYFVLYLSKKYLYARFLISEIRSNE